MKKVIIDLSKPIGEQETIVDLTAEEIAASEAQFAANQIDVAKREALAALTATDMVAIRCIKASAPFPAEWQAYVADLRAVVAGTSSTLPVQPIYPVGT